MHENINALSTALSAIDDVPVKQIDRVRVALNGVYLYAIRMINELTIQ